MTISAPNFTRLQDGIKSVDDLRVRGPLNVALAYLSGSLVTQLNSHFGEVSTSISNALSVFRTTTVTWSSPHTISLSSGTTPLTLRAVGGSAPNLTLDNPTTGAGGAEIGQINFNGRGASSSVITYAFLDVTLADVTAGSEDGQMRMVTLVNGALTATLGAQAGVIIGSPTGTYQGAGTLNLDNALYKDGTQVVSSRVTGYGDPFGAISRATISVTTVTTAALASFVAAMYTDLKAHGLIGN
jgi:hypothetical protein